MTAWIIVANLILLALTTGSFVVWLQSMYIHQEIAIILCFFTLIFSMVSSLLIVKKALTTKKRCYLLYFIIPVIVLLAIIIFRTYITGFLNDLLALPLELCIVPPKITD